MNLTHLSGNIFIAPILLPLVLKVFSQICLLEFVHQQVLIIAYKFCLTFEANMTVNSFRLKVVRPVRIVFTIEGHPLRVPM